MYQFERFSMDTERLELRADGALVEVQPQVFSLIVYLVENRARVVTKDEVFDEVWEGRIVSDGTLNARINAARRALGDDGTAQRIIRTFPRRGFRFVADVTSGGQAVSPLSAAPVTAPEIPLALDKPSIAVLPFGNLSSDPDQEFFADGLTEDLITDLSKNSNLFVIARNSSFAFKGQSPDVRDVGQSLGVAHVLEGSVRKVGNKVRINAQLVNALTGGHVWAERYDGDMEDIFALQDDITAQIVAALEVNLMPGQGGSQRTTESAEAYELYLRARATFYRFTPAAFAETVHLATQAVAIDPNFADAYATMVFPHQSGWSFMWEGYDDAIGEALRVAEKGAELAPRSALCQSRLGWVNMIIGHHDTAAEHFRNSLENNPNDADTLAYHAEAMNFAGHPETAIDLVDKALRFDPFIPPNCAYHMGHALFLLERYDDAEDHISDCIDVAPGFPPAQLTMIALLMATGRVDEGKSRAQDLLAVHPLINVSKFNARYPYADDGHRDRVLNGLRSAGIPER